MAIGWHTRSLAPFCGLSRCLKKKADEKVANQTRPTNVFDFDVAPWSFPNGAKARSLSICRHSIDTEVTRAMSSAPWFRRPPGAACSIEWFPKEMEDENVVLPKLRRGGAMIEFLLPRKALRPAFVIHPATSLQAIAAVIFADFSNGVEHRTCDFCNSLFPVGNQKGKRFCNQTKCKNAAHSREMRKKKREQKYQTEGGTREITSCNQGTK